MVLHVLQALEHCGGHLLCTLVYLCPSCTWEPQVRCSTAYAVLQVPNRGGGKSLHLLSVLLSRIFLLLFAAHSLLVLNLSTRTHGSFPVELLSSQLASSLCHHVGYSFTSTGIYLCLLNSRKFLAAHFSSLLSPLKQQLSGMLTTTHLFGIICKIADWSPCFCPGCYYKC